jgi:hypothetical protein
MKSQSRHYLMEEEEIKLDILLIWFSHSILKHLSQHSCLCESETHKEVSKHPLIEYTSDMPNLEQID